MPVQCIFYTPGQPVPCRVLALVPHLPGAWEAMAAHEATVCATGIFITCPVFRRVEEGLERYHGWCRSTAGAVTLRRPRSRAPGAVSVSLIGEARWRVVQAEVG